jgi:hypothetical protein
MKKILKCFLFLLPLTTLFYLIFRIFYGLDFTDEMQYYGQIQGLVSEGRLFVHDLFIQQTGYILIYPFLNLIFSSDLNLKNLIIYCRVLLFFLVILVSLLAYLLTSNYKLSSRIFGSSIIAISITEFLPFAFSYNIFAFLLIAIVATFWLFYNCRYKIFILAFFNVLLGWAYPNIGLILVIIIFLDYFFFISKKIALKFIIYLLTLSIIFFAKLYYLDFFDIISFKDSLVFSVNFSKYKTYSLFSILIAISIFVSNFFFILLIIYEFKFLFFLRKNYNILFFALSFIFLLIGISLIFYKYYQHSIIFMYASICALILEKKIISLEKHKLIRILVLSMSVSYMFSFSSGNGFMVVYKGFLITLGFLYLVYSSLVFQENKKITYISILGFIIFFSLLLNIIYNPYRDKFSYNAQNKINNVNAFNNLFISHDKFLAIQEIKKKIKLDDNKNLMIIGPHPWIYFALNVNPNTPLFFMHSYETLKDKIEIEGLKEFLINKIKTKDPHYVLDVSPNSESVSFFLKNLKEMSVRYNCKILIINNEFNTTLQSQNNYYFPSKVTLCEKLKF